MQRRCAATSSRCRMAADALTRAEIGSSSAKNPGFQGHPPTFKFPSKSSGAGYDHPGRCKALGISRAPGVYCAGLEHPWSLD